MEGIFILLICNHQICDYRLFLSVNWLSDKRLVLQKEAAEREDLPELAGREGDHGVPSNSE